MKFKTLILIFSAILTMSLFILLWLIDYSNFGIPEKIPNTNLYVYGLATLGVFILVLALFQKRITFIDQSVSVLQLILLTALIAVLLKAFTRESGISFCLMDQRFRNL